MFCTHHYGLYTKTLTDVNKTPLRTLLKHPYGHYAHIQGCSVPNISFVIYSSTCATEVVHSNANRPALFQLSTKNFKRVFTGSHVKTRYPSTTKTFLSTSSPLKVHNPSWTTKEMVKHLKNIFVCSKLGWGTLGLTTSSRLALIVWCPRKIGTPCQSGRRGSPTSPCAG